MRLAVLLCVLSLGCSAAPDGSDGGTDAGSSSDAGGLADGSDGGCASAVNTTATATVSASGCAVRDRDVSSCSGARIAAGLSGVWLKFSCRVTLEKVGNAVRASSDSVPDYPSNYFPRSNACWESYTAATQNPNFIAAQNLAIDFPLQPTTTSQSMLGGAVGMALNGVAIFSNKAAPGDDIYREVTTFDRCGAHPQQTGMYHYHGEPYALSNDDARLIGVLRDGYPVYGRRDLDGSVPTDLDAQGGHSGVTADSDGAATYHYHLNLQTSSSPTSAGQMQWFLTSGAYHGGPGTCTGC